MTDALYDLEKALEYAETVNCCEEVKCSKATLAQIKSMVLQPSSFTVYFFSRVAGL